jgi:type I restriction enzyme S subunit
MNRRGAGKAGWVTKRLGEIATTQYGLSVPMNEEGNGFKIFRMGEVQNGRLIDSGNMKRADISKTEFQRYRLRPGDVLFNRTNSFELVGKTGIFALDGDYCFASYLVRLNPDPTLVLPEFLNYFMNSERFQRTVKEKASRSINQANINATILSNELISIPVALPEQQRIVGILDEAFDAIATAKANAEKNLQNARALFESHLQAVFTHRGEGWFRTTIGEQVMLQRGFDITKDQQKPGKVPVVSSGGVKSFHDTAMAHAPGVVLGRKGTLGKVFYLDEDYWPHDTTLWVKEFKGNAPRFVYHFFTNLDVVHLDSGTANPALNRNQVHPIEVDWPIVCQQSAIAAKIDTLRADTQRLESIYQQKLAALDALKKSLLDQAFTGKL